MQPLRTASRVEGVTYAVRDVVLWAQPLAGIPSRSCGVDDGDDGFTPVADDAQRGLGSNLAELTLAQDHVAAIRCVHATESDIAERPRGAVRGRRVWRWYRIPDSNR